MKTVIKSDANGTMGLWIKGEKGVGIMITDPATLRTLATQAEQTLRMQAAAAQPATPPQVAAPAPTATQPAMNGQPA